MRNSQRLRRPTFHTVVAAVVCLSFLLVIGVVPRLRTDAQAQTAPLPQFQASQVAVGAQHSCALLVSKNVWCWGQGALGQIANGTSGSTTPIQVPDLNSVSAIESSWWHTCAVLSDKTAKCWGYNGERQLANDSTLEIVPTPLAVLGEVGSTTALPNIATISPGITLTCAKQSDGTPLCWGANDKSQLARTGTGSTRPEKITGIGKVLDIQAGGSHACAVAQDGTVWCWGDNQYGQLGSSVGSQTEVPTRVPGVFGATKLALSNAHSCALLGTGGVFCWGLDGYGQSSGDGVAKAPVTQISPTAIPSISDAVAISVGTAHSCAIRTTDRLVCWGYNYRGQIGNGLTSPSEPPTDPGLLNVTSVDLGQHFTCAVANGGASGCWGWNANGQLGESNVGDVSTPKSVSYNDADGDGLLDDWETNGYTAPDGTFIDLPAMGASPTKKDLFIEVDYMVRPEECAFFLFRCKQSVSLIEGQSFDKIKAAFASKGVEVHIDSGVGSLGAGRTESGVVPYQKLLTLNQAQSYRANNLGRGRSNIFRYVLFADLLDEDRNASGRSLAIPSDMVVVLSGPENDASDVREFALFHELGHSLGLYHGGKDGYNFKPNYQSAMNYLYAVPALNTRRFLDAYFLSDRAARTFDTSAMPENISSDSLGLIGKISRECGLRNFYDLVAPVAEVDWNCDGTIAPSRYGRTFQGESLTPEYGKTTTLLQGTNDWENIRYSGGSVGGNLTLLPPAEARAEAPLREALAGNFPVNPFPVFRAPDRVGVAAGVGVVRISVDNTGGAGSISYNTLINGQIVTSNTKVVAELSTSFMDIEFDTTQIASSSFDLELVELSDVQARAKVRIVVLDANDQTVRSQAALFAASSEASRPENAILLKTAQAIAGSPPISTSTSLPQTTTSTALSTTTPTSTTTVTSSTPPSTQPINPCRLSGHPEHDQRLVQAGSVVEVEIDCLSKHVPEAVIAKVFNCDQRAWVQITSLAPQQRGGAFRVNWKTDKSWARKCASLQLEKSELLYKFR